MADFCKQCSIELFDENFGELANLVTEAQFNEGKVAFVLCEGCGSTTVDHTGTCIFSGCLRKHVAPIDPIDPELTPGF